jgi:predicted nucleic acid-binding protein
MRHPWVARRRIQASGRLLLGLRMLIWMLRLEVRVEAEERMCCVVRAEVVVEEAVVLEQPLRDAKEALKAEEVEVEARDSLAERLGEAEAAARQEMMRRSYGDLVEAAHAAHVGLKALNFWVLREVEERVQEVGEGAAPRESETVC